MAAISITLKTGTTPYRIDQLKKIPAGDFGENFNFTIQDSSGTALPITGTTPKFVPYRSSPRTKSLQQVMSKDCTIDSGAGGTCHYTVQNSDFFERTTYLARIEIFTGTTKIESTEYFMLEVF